MLVDLKYIYYQAPYLVFIDLDLHMVYVIDIYKQAWTQVLLADLYFKRYDGETISYKTVSWKPLEKLEKSNIQAVDGRYRLYNVAEVIYLLFLVNLIPQVMDMMSKPDHPIMQFVKDNPEYVLETANMFLKGK